MKNKFLRCVIFTVIAIMLFCLCSEVFKRKTIDGAWNFTVKSGSFFRFPENSIDVLAIGSSHAYCSVNPNVLWQEGGISSWVLSSQRQSTAMSYYYLKEALKTQSPKVVIYETYMLNNSEQYPEEGIVRDACEYLPFFSLNRIKLINASVPLGERAEYYFTLFKYHSRWKELKGSDFDFSYKNIEDPYRGYVFLKENSPANVVPIDMSSPQDITESDLKYLNKMIELSEEYGFSLVLMIAPGSFDEPSFPKIAGAAKFAQENDIPFINGIDVALNIGIDVETDFFDSRHLNIYGSRKFSTYLAGYLNDNFELSEVSGELAQRLDNELEYYLKKESED